MNLLKVCIEKEKNKEIQIKCVSIERLKLIKYASVVSRCQSKQRTQTQLELDVEEVEVTKKVVVGKLVLGLGSVTTLRNIWSPHRSTLICRYCCQQPC